MIRYLNDWLVDWLIEWVSERVGIIGVILWFSLSFIDANLSSKLRRHADTILCYNYKWIHRYSISWLSERSGLSPAKKINGYRILIFGSHASVTAEVISINSLCSMWVEVIIYTVTNTKWNYPHLSLFSIECIQLMRTTNLK